MKRHLKLFSIFSIAAALLLLNGCKKKPCEETWTIKGRLLNGTTLQPIKNVFFSVTLYDVDGNDKAKNETNVGQALTDDSGYFSIEYPCQNKDFDEIALRTLAPYGGYVRENVIFDKHYNNTFYYSTQGRVIIILKPKTPLGSDTLFIETSLPGLNKKDLLTTEINGLWIDFRTLNNGGGQVLAARSQSRLDSIKNYKSGYQSNGWWTFPNGLRGDPFIDTLIVNY